MPAESCRLQAGSGPRAKCGQGASGSRWPNPDQVGDCPLEPAWSSAGVERPDSGLADCSQRALAALPAPAIRRTRLRGWNLPGEFPEKGPPRRWTNDMSLWQAQGVSIHSGEYLGPRRLALARTKGGKVRPAGAGWARSPRWGSSLRRWASVVGKLASWPQRGVKLRAGQCCRVRERVLPLAARWPESSSVWEVRGVPPCAARPSLTGAMGTGPMGPGPGCAHRHPANPAGTGTGSAQPLSLSAAR